MGNSSTWLAGQREQVQLGLEQAMQDGYGYRVGKGMECNLAHIALHHREVALMVILLVPLNKEEKERYIPIKFLFHRSLPRHFIRETGNNNCNSVSMLLTGEMISVEATGFYTNQKKVPLHDHAAFKNVEHRPSSLPRGLKAHLAQGSSLSPRLFPFAKALPFRQGSSLSPRLFPFANYQPASLWS